MTQHGRPRPIGSMLPGSRKWAKESNIWIPEIDREQRFRIDRLKQELSLDDRAAADGHGNRPPASDKTLNEPQLEICNRVFSGILMLNQFLAEQLGSALDSARRRAPKKLDLQDFKARMSQDVNAEFAEYAPELRQLSTEDLARQADLRWFRQVNRLNTTADYKHSILLPIGTILGLLVLESVMNSFLFQEVVSNGLLGGWILAFLISGLNIAAGLTAGLYGWRYTGHVKPSRKALGWAITIGIHSAAVFWNLLVGHFREVAGNQAKASANAAASNAYNFDIGQLANESWAHMQTHGLFGIGSILAWGLVALGLLIHFIASKEGWDDFADRYPDYKKVDVRAKDARANFEDALREMRRTVRDAAEEAAKDAEAVCSRAQGDLTVIAALEDLAKQREREVRDSEDEWVTGGSQLLKAYRDVNRNVRAEGTSPAYFETYPTAADYRQRKFGSGANMEGDIDAHAAATAERLKAIATLKADSEAIIRQNDEKLLTLRNHINELMEGLDPRIEETRAQVKREAQEEMEKGKEGSH